MYSPDTENQKPSLRMSRKVWVNAEMFRVCPRVGRLGALQGHFSQVDL